MNGTLIVFEGGEGVGKSTQVNPLRRALQADGHIVVATREPGDTEIGKRIREMILDHDGAPLHPHTELMLFLADRAQHVEQVIRPALERGEIVICDRFSASTFAYQIGGRGLEPAEQIMAMDAFARNGVTPDMTLFFDLSPADGLARRVKNNEELNRMDNETLGFHERVYNFFQQMASTETNWHTIDASQSPEEIAQHIYSLISSQL